MGKGDQEYDYDKIVTEWFYRLDEGYATPPYSVGQLKVLREVVEDLGYNEEAKHIISRIKTIQEKDESDDDDEVECVDWMYNACTFSGYVRKNYVKRGQHISGLKYAYKHILECEHSDELLSLIDRSFNFRLMNRNIDINTYVEQLYSILNKTIKVKGGDFSELWFAILFNGKCVGGLSDNSRSDVVVNNKSISIKNISRLGRTPICRFYGDCITEFYQGLNILQIASGFNLKPHATHVGFNNFLGSIENANSINNLSNLFEYKDSNAFVSSSFGYLDRAFDVDIVDNVSKSVCVSMDNILKDHINRVDYWAIISNDKNSCYIISSDRLFDKIRTKNNRVSDCVIGFLNRRLWINFNKIIDKPKVSVG